jgi:hypothetical protein
MKQIDRIKLMMSYDSKKTLNENLEEIDVVNENDVDIDEAVGGAEAREIAKALKGGAGEAEMIAKYAKNFGMSNDAVKLALAKDLTTLDKDIATSVRNDAKNGVRVGSTNTLGPAAKAASKAKAIKEIMAKGANITDKEIIAIIERTKNDSKAVARKIEGTATKSAATRTANATKEVSDDVKKITNAEEAGKVVVNVNTGNITQGAAAETNAAVQASKEIAPEAKSVAEEAKKVVEEMKPSKWQKFKNIVRKLKPKYWILLGLAGLAGWYLWKFLKSLQPQKELFPKCLDDLLDDEGTTIRATSGGDPVVSVTSTGNREYDQKGGLWFFNTGRVFTVDQSKRGYWSCKGSEVTIAEQGDSNPHTGVDNVITIKWDGETSPVKSGGGDGGGSGESNPKPDNSKFHDCSQKDFPFEVGCISPKIAEVQKCLGVEPQKGYLGPKTISALIDLHFETKDGLTKDVYDKVMAACKESEPKPTEAPKVDTPKTDNPATAPITPPPAPAEPVFDKNRLQELLASKNLVKKRKGVIIKWKGPELSGEDYFILNKYLEDQGYIQKKQRETGDRDDEDVTMKYKWKQVGEPEATTEPEA